VKQVEDRQHLFVFEGVHLWREFEFLIAIGVALLLWLSYPNSSMVMVSFSFD